MADAAAPELTYRISPVQTALLILLACPCLAANIYLHLSGPVRLVTLLIGLGALVLAAATWRMYVVADDEGVAVRYLGREQWLPWSEVDRVEVVSGVRGADTIRFTRTDGTYVNAPPSLLQPSRPTGRPAARRRLQDIQRQFEARRAAD
jgi:hypothetical protein